jgi:hypothetical protein
MHFIGDSAVPFRLPPGNIQSPSLRRRTRRTFFLPRFATTSFVAFTIVPPFAKT